MKACSKPKIHDKNFTYRSILFVISVGSELEEIELDLEPACSMACWIESIQTFRIFSVRRPIVIDFSEPTSPPTGKGNVTKSW